MGVRRLLLTALAVFSIIVILPLVSFAQGKNTASPTAQPKVETATPAAKPTVEYALPYPGILPDHPLYSLKMIRDRIVSWFISDPLKKAEYNLLQADKRLNSGIFLKEKGEMDLAVKSFVEGEEFLEKALDEAEKAQKAGKSTNALISKFSLAALKHQEVLQSVLETAPESAKKGLGDSLEKSQKSIERIKAAQQVKLEKRLQERLAGKKIVPVGVEAKGK